MAKDQKHEKDGGMFFFVVNPKHIRTHAKYKRHRTFSAAMTEAVRLSSSHGKEQFFIYEGKPLGQIVDGKPVA